jgi:hypothetical protein
LFRKPETRKNIILINRFAVIVPYITLKVTPLDPSLFYVQRLVKQVLAMPIALRRREFACMKHH